MDKLVIGICNKKLTLMKQMKKLIEDLLNTKEISNEVLLYPSINELMKNKKEIANLIFLDANLLDEYGTKQEMRVHLSNFDCKIAIMSCNIKHVKDAYRMNALRFIINPLDIDELEEVISAYMYQSIEACEIALYHDRNRFNIPQKEVKYVKAYNGYIEAEVNGKTFRKDITLHKIEEILDRNMFIKVNGGYLVNLFWILNYKKDIGMIEGDGFKIQVSRRKKKEFEKMWTFFDLCHV